MSTPRLDQADIGWKRFERRERKFTVFCPTKARPFLLSRQDHCQASAPPWTNCTGSGVSGTLLWQYQPPERVQLWGAVNYGRNHVHKNFMPLSHPWRLHQWNSSRESEERLTRSFSRPGFTPGAFVSWPIWERCGWVSDWSLWMSMEKLTKKIIACCSVIRKLPSRFLMITKQALAAKTLSVSLSPCLFLSDVCFVLNCFHPFSYAWQATGQYRRRENWHQTNFVEHASIKKPLGLYLSNSSRKTRRAVFQVVTLPHSPSRGVCKKYDAWTRNHTTDQ